MNNKKIFLSRTIALALTASILACGGGSGGNDACSTLKVAGGDTCTSVENPVVLLFIDNGQICSGTIITRTSVITAAHCVVNARNITVLHRNASEKVTQAFFNKQYTGGVHPYDLAIVKVSTAFTDTANFSPLPIQLNKDVPEGQRVSIFGFGIDESGRPSVNLPRAGFLKVIGLIQGMIAAEIDNSFGLQGDSGGPLVFDNALIGVFSGFIPDPALNFFVNLRDPVNLAFLNEVASDTAVKMHSDTVKNAVTWYPLVDYSN